jgi:drug/metabolite transporter (DMT)-like permease
VSGGFKFVFDAAILPYVFAFGTAYGTASVASYFAIRKGSLSLTSLVTSYSLVIPTMYGLLFLGDDAGVFFYIGLALLLISLLVIGLKRDEGEGKVKITAIWIFYVSLAFVGNGLCSSFQTAQQKAFLGAYKTELMILSLLIVAVTLFVFSLIFERDVFLPTVKTCLPYAVAFGIINGAVNLFVMMLTGGGKLDVSIIFPTISAGGIIATGAVAIFFYKEKLSKMQSAGLVLGILAVVFMNI